MLPFVSEHSQRHPLESGRTVTAAALALSRKTPSSLRINQKHLQAEFGIAYMKAMTKENMQSRSSYTTRDSSSTERLSAACVEFETVNRRLFYFAELDGFEN
ncbi:unnamed protein product [Gongylonema pulchrum]|uniref:Uncharacterized protein n=1 Tax=Gongylonema pulchrum TaxID=637853 RepID=A0A183D309_9BILA|nr:unnamed protein product [Gongylonema pulchrum]